jgi:hypothetical protein
MNALEYNRLMNLDDGHLFESAAIVRKGYVDRI